MITYHFRCECGVELEKKYRISEDHTTHCPECGKEMEKVISGNPFLLKGKGWYKPGHGL